MNIKNNLILLLKSIFAGLCIAIAGIVSSYATLAIAPFIFSIGLILIILGELKLYTGIIGVSNNIKEILIVFLGNFIGAGAGALYYLSYSIPDSLLLIIQNKELLSISQLLTSSFFCGILMYTAVVLSKNKENRLFIVIFCVASFIIGKFEHSIADIFYFSINGFSLKDIINIITIAFGNMVGAKTFNFIYKLGEKHELL